MEVVEAHFFGGLKSLQWTTRRPSAEAVTFTLFIYLFNFYVYALKFSALISPLPLPDDPLPQLSETRLYCNTQVDIEASWGQDKATSITNTTTASPQPTIMGLSTTAQQQQQHHHQQQQPTNTTQKEQQQEQQTATTNTAARDLESQLSQILHQSEAAPPPPSMAMTDSSLREVLNS